MFKEIEHTKFYTSIIQQQLVIVVHVRKSLSFSKGKLWEKTMGNYNVAEIFKLVSLYILSILWQVYGIQNVGLYRDDGFSLFW